MRRMVVLTLITWLVVGIPSSADTFADESSAFSSKLVLKQDFHDAKYWPARQTKQSIEFCGGDWCQEVIGRNSQSAESAWDAAFIMFYFFDANDEFRGRRKVLAATLIDEYGKGCIGSSEIRAACVLGKLQVSHGFEYRRVQYDIGHRCSSIFSAPPLISQGAEIVCQ